MNTVLKLFIELFRRFTWHFILLFGLVFMQVFLNALSVVAVAPIIDLLLEREGDSASQVTKTLTQLLDSAGMELNLINVFMFFGGLTLFSGAAGSAIKFTQLRIKYDVLIYLINEILGQFFRARFLFFSQGDMGKLLNSFQQELNKVGDNFGAIANLMANLLQAIIFLAVPLTLSPKITLIFVAGTFLLTSPLWMLRRVTYHFGKRNTETTNVVVGLLHETLTASKLILGFGRQENAVQRYNDAVAKHAKISVIFQTLLSGVGLFFTPLGMIAALIALYIGYIDGIPFSEMAMVMFALLRLMPIAGLLMQGKANIDGFTPAYEQLENLRRQAVALEEPLGRVTFSGLQKGLCFKKVFFSFPGRKTALNDVSLWVRKGQMTALVGESGAGKTTLVDLMLGLYEKDAGQILLDGKELEEYALNSFRSRVGYVPQDPQLFNTTVRENLLWSAPEATEQDIWQACKLANAEQFVRELPEGLETILGDRGVRLSGGQRQRLALARAIIRKPDLLILDEATSSLDTESERLIQQSIENLSGEMTIVVISHRLSTIAKADSIHVLHQGQIVESGTYSELSRSNGRFGQMIRSQQLDA